MRSVITLFSKHICTLLSGLFTCIIVTSYLFLSSVPDLRLAVPYVVAISAFITGILATILYAGEKKLVRFSPITIVLIAVLVRLLFLLRPPELSDDIFRYLWDGLQLLAGNNPYSFAPADVQQYHEQTAELVTYINHPDLVTIYPPAAQLLFGIGAFFGGSFFGLKALFIVLDIGVCMIMLKLLANLQKSPTLGVLYAWHPLPVIEISASGHIDGAGIFFLLFSLLLLTRHSTEIISETSKGKSIASLSTKSFLAFCAGIAFSVSSLVKLFPIIFLPGLLIFMARKSRNKFLLGMFSGAIILIAPFMSSIYNMLITLGIYMQNWEFSSFSFRILRRITSSGDLTRITLAILFFIVLVTQFFKLLKRKKTILSKNNKNYENLPYASMNKEFILMIKSLYFITFAYLFLTPTIYPWYSLYLVCFLPFHPSIVGIVFSWSIFLSYRVLIPYAFLNKWSEDNLTPILIWVAPLSAFILSATIEKMKTINLNSSNN